MDSPPLRGMVPHRKRPILWLGAEYSEEDVIIHLDDLTAIAVNQQGVITVAHPHRAGWRRFKSEIHIIIQPVILGPEQGRQDFAEHPMMGVPAARPAIFRGMEAVRGGEVALEECE